MIMLRCIRLYTSLMCYYIVVVCVAYFFFFFKQKTAYEMRISDWSSDVCSSDLSGWLPAHHRRASGEGRQAASRAAGDGRLPRLAVRLLHAGLRHVDRKSVV